MLLRQRAHVIDAFRRRLVLHVGDVAPRDFAEILRHMGTDKARDQAEAMGRVAVGHEVEKNDMGQILLQLFGPDIGPSRQRPVSALALPVGEKMIGDGIAPGDLGRPENAKMIEIGSAEKRFQVLSAEMRSKGHTRSRPFHSGATSRKSIAICLPLPAIAPCVPIHASTGLSASAAMRASVRARFSTTRSRASIVSVRAR